MSTVSETAPPRAVPDTIRPARIDDAAAVWRLVDDDSGLDRNSPYAYVLCAERFGDTFLVAESGGALTGFVLAVRSPAQPGTAFVWQIAVARAARGRGLASRLLHALADHGARGAVRAVEATVTPGNAASEALFRGFARDRGAALRVTDDHFPATLFAGGTHEPERLFRIAPVHRDTDEVLSR